MKKPIVLVLSTLMLGISATAMADSGHRWNNDHGKTMIDMSIVMTAVMIIVMITERQFGQMLIVVSIMVTMLLLNVVNVFLQYRHSRYYVSDWRAHRLYAPPRGYHWVKTLINTY